MKCTNCGAEIPDGNRFCTNCGSRAPSGSDAAQTCAKCGRPIADGFSFCLGCGTPVNSGGSDTDTPGNSGGFIEVPRPAPAARETKTFEDSTSATVPCLSCGAPLPEGTTICTRCGAYQYEPSKSGHVKSSGSTNRSKTVMLAVIFALVAALAALVVLLATGTLGDLFGSNSESAAQTEPAEDNNAATDDGIDYDVPESEPESSEELEEQDYLLPDSATRYLSNADLEDLSWRELCLARNEIFARHGRRFITPEIAEYFNSKDWYQPLYDEVTLSDLETANVNLIRDYENAHFGGSYY